MPCYFHRQFKVLFVLCFANFAVLLLPVQTAEGQVHGSGVSAAALFDTVVNLPDDSATFSQNSIGGVAGETAQLNVRPGSTFGSLLGSGFDAYPGTEINFTGGTTNHDFFSATGSEINLIGGDIYSSLSVGDSQVNVSGGRIHRDISVSDSQVNISGGSVGVLFANLRSVINIDGGAVSNLLTTGNSSTININGGSFDGLESGRGVFNIRGGNFSTDPRFLNQFYDGSTVNLIGTEFFIDGVPYTDGDSLVVTDEFFTLSGTWEDGTSFVFDVEEVVDYTFPAVPPVGGAGHLAPLMLFDFGFGSTLNVTVVPEPSSAAFIALAYVLGSVRRRRG